MEILAVNFGRHYVTHHIYADYRGLKAHAGIVAGSKRFLRDSVRWLSLSPRRIAILMRKVNTAKIEEITWSSPKGKFAGAGKEISEELGRQPDSTDLKERHPFDVEICRIPPGKTPYPYHAHSAQWEFYHVISGSGVVRHKDGTTPIEPGDAFLFKPGEPHQILNEGAEDLVLYVVADNPMGEAYYYPDSNKWSVPIPERRLLRSDALEYYEGEE